MIRLPDLVIPIGTAESNAVSLEQQYIHSLCLWSPAVLPETVTVYVSPGGSVWQPLFSNGVAVTVPVSAAPVLSAGPAPWRSVKLVSAGNVAAARTFQLAGGSLE